MIPKKPQPIEIVLPQSKIILVDLDKTLIDTGYNITDNAIYEEIRRVQNLGWQVGLSSDTALEPLEVWREKFGMNGPLIAEKGSVVWLPGGQEFIKIETKDFFSALRASLIKELVQNRIPFLFGDATQFTRNNPMLTNMVDKRLVLLQAYRRCSMSFYGRQLNENGNVIIDNDLTVELIQKVRDIIGSCPPLELDEDFNPEYGVYILAPKLTNKREGTLTLIQELGIERVGMIGDSSSDILGGDIAFHYSVGNAKQELKKTSCYIASQEYTKGVIEILKLIKN